MPVFEQKPIIFSSRVYLKPGCEAAFADWQAKLNGKITAFPGFVSLEFLAPDEKQQGWVIVQRFIDNSSADAWHRSQELQVLMESLKAFTEPEGIQEISTKEASIREGITEVIVTEVQPAKEKEYQAWTARIHQAEAKFPGFRGVYIQSPKGSKGKYWITLLQFDNRENLDKWLDSDERKIILEESKAYINYIESHRIISPYAGWFASIAKKGEIPPVWKQTMLVLLVLFPIIMFEIKYLSPWTKDLNTALATFIGNAISVTLIAFPFMPIALFFLGWWPAANRENKWVSIGGTILVLILYLLEIAIFWKF